MSRILVVDDDPDMRALVGAFLKSAGHELDFAEDGVGGAVAVGRQMPDLIVTDFQMPRMDGFSLFNAVRADPRAARVPVIMLTAHNSREMMQKALSLGLDDFLGKPITRDDLLRVVAERLRPAAAAPAPPPARPARPQFFGSVLCCSLCSLERFALALKKEELDALLAKFAADAAQAVQRDGGSLTHPDFRHLYATFDDAAPAHALRALRGALGVVLAAQRFKPWIASRFAGRDLPEFVVALGVHSGTIQVAPTGAVEGEAAGIAAFLAESSLNLRWSVAASRAAAQSAEFAFLAGRGAQLRLPNSKGSVKVVEVRGLAPEAAPAPQATRAATLIEAAIGRNATLVGFAGAAPKPAPAPAVAPADAPARTAQLFAGYQVVRQLADNGVVAVYLVHPAGGGPQQVLKTIAVANAAEKRPHLQKFVDQYAALGAVEHPNIARVSAQGLTSTHLYVVQEYCPGGDLRNLIAERMVPGDAVKTLLRLAGGLRAAHQKGFVHGDLKPANVMIRADGSFAIIDFALARVIEYAIGEGETGVLVRSPEYLSPEMINGLPADVKGDIYTLGLLLHEMLTGQRAYDSPDLSRVMMDHLKAPVPLLPSGLEPFQPLLGKLMAKARDERFASVQEVIAYLAQAKLQG